MSKTRDWRVVKPAPPPPPKSTTLCIEEGCTRPRKARKRCLPCYRVLRKHAVLGRVHLSFEVVEQLFREHAPISTEDFSEILGVNVSSTRRWIARLVGAEVAFFQGRTVEAGPQAGSRDLYGVLAGPVDEEYRTAADRLLEGGGTVASHLVPADQARAAYRAR